MSQRILIIEDDEASRAMYNEILTMENYEVVEAEDGKMALEYLKNNPKPNLILMDLTFPNGTPEQFVQGLKQNPATAAIPVVLISGQGSIEDQAAEMNAASFLKKPFDMDDFINIVKTNL